MDEKVNLGFWESNKTETPTKFITHGTGPRTVISILEFTKYFVILYVAMQCKGALEQFCLHYLTQILKPQN